MPHLVRTSLANTAWRRPVDLMHSLLHWLRSKIMCTMQYVLRVSECQSCLDA